MLLNQPVTDDRLLQLADHGHQLRLGRLAGALAGAVGHRRRPHVGRAARRQLPSGRGRAAGGDPGQRPEACEASAPLTNDRPAWPACWRLRRASADEDVRKPPDWRPGPWHDAARWTISNGATGRCRAGTPASMGGSSPPSQHPHLLPSQLPGPHAQAGERPLLPHGSRGPASGFSGLPALPPRCRAGVARVARAGRTWRRGR